VDCAAENIALLEQPAAAEVEHEGRLESALKMSPMNLVVGLWGIGITHSANRNSRLSARSAFT